MLVPGRALAALVLLLGFAPRLGAQPDFVDVTNAAQLDFINVYGPTFPGLSPTLTTLQRNMGNGVAVGDYDDDGDLDIYLLAQLGHPNRLYRNELDQGSKTFTDVTPAVLADTGLSRSAEFVDLNEDGHRDLILINDADAGGVFPPSRIFRNNGDGTFTDRTEGSGFDPTGYFRCGLTVVDYDADGRVDIYVTNWGAHGRNGPPELPGWNRLYRNRGNFIFEDVTTQVGLGILDRDSFSAIFTDFDADRDVDLFVAVDHSTDEFYRNDGGTFVSATASAGTDHVANDMGVACEDFDTDGDLDLYVTNITDPSGAFGGMATNVFYVNQLDSSGVVEFEDEAVDRGVNDTYWGWGTQFVDADNDFDLDLVAVTGFDEFILEQDGSSNPVYETSSVLFLNDGTGQYSRHFGTALDEIHDSRGLVCFDYDRDGDRDLLITNVNERVVLLENVTPSANRWLTVVLSPDRDALGAVVTATVGAVTLRRHVLSGRSYLAGVPLEVHFGLRAETRVDTLRIQWPDGVEEVLTDVPADQVVRIDRSPLRGSVRSASGLPSDVLLVNGHAGAGVFRRVSLVTGVPLSVSLLAPPQGPTSSVDYVLWLWGEGAPVLTPLTAGMELIGVMANPTPLHPGLAPQPLACIRSAGLPRALCRGVTEKAGPGSAPFVVNRAGLNTPRRMILQGLLVDDGSGNSTGFSVSNGIVIDVRR